jgi:hypothetical protein
MRQENNKRIALETTRQTPQPNTQVEIVEEQYEDNAIVPTKQRCYTPTPPSRTPQIISQEALAAVCQRGLAYRAFVTPPTHDIAPPPPLEHFCAPVVHPVTGEPIISYKKLARNPLLREIWTTAMGKEFGNMAQGDKKTGTPGTDSIFVMTHKEIANIPKDCVVTYARLVVDYRQQKEDPNRV